MPQKAATVVATPPASVPTSVAPVKSPVARSPATAGIGGRQPHPPAAAPNLAQSQLVLPDDAPSLEECEAAVRCLRSFEPPPAALAKKRGIPAAPLHLHTPPREEADSFALANLESFFNAKRRFKAEFSPDLLARMATAASLSSTIDAPSLRAAAAIGPYAEDWRCVLRLAAAHAQRARSARAHKLGAIMSSPRAAQQLLMTSPRGHDLGGDRSLLLASSRPTTSSSSARGAKKVLLPPAAAAGGAAAAHHSHAHHHGTDEFRDERGRKRLYLPVMSHPAWSQHSDNGFYADSFDDARRDATGRSVREFLESQGRGPYNTNNNAVAPSSSMVAMEELGWHRSSGATAAAAADQQQLTTTTISSSRAARGLSAPRSGTRRHTERDDQTTAKSESVTTANRAAAIDCGTTLVLGRRHPRVSRGALLLDLSKLTGSTFSAYFSEQTKGTEKLPMDEAMHRRAPKPPMTARVVRDPDVQRRIDESIAQVASYLDGVC